MNDRFKFRAWDKSINVLRESGTFDLVRGFHNPSFIVEQCTGLKDKNGRLIYEGDIVFHRAKNVEIGKVTWEKGGFWIVCNKFVIPWSFLTPSLWEMVGNIHENPELLEDK